MCRQFNYLKANEDFAQYWYRENHDSNIIAISPHRHPYRSVFACDRDRVMYCSSFRRLSSKTQVFNSRTSDNLRTRLTHTLEVAQIARTISSQLGLDENLTEAIAYGHDVGHTPFGHVGERTLNEFSNGKHQKDDSFTISNSYRGFKHNLQSVRVLVEYSESVKFSNYMLFGVREHSKLNWSDYSDVAFYDFYNKYCSYEDIVHPAWSFESYIVKWADEVAQRHHDIEDAFLQNIIPARDIVNKVSSLAHLTNNASLTRKFNRLSEEADRLNNRDFTAVQYSFAHTLSSFLVDTYVSILINEFSRVLKHFSNMHSISSSESFKEKYLDISVNEIRDTMRLENSGIYRIDKALGESLKYSVLDSYEVQRMDGKGAFIIRKLVHAYSSNPQQLPNEYINRFIKNELIRRLSTGDYNKFMSTVKSNLHGINDNVILWKDYECREVLRVIVKNKELLSTVYDALLRIIFDYIAGMTDSYAESQYSELY